MEDLSAKYNDLKFKYRGIFLETAKKIQDEISKLKPEGFVGDIFESYAKDSLGFQWQEAVLSLLKAYYSDKIPMQISEIKSLRKSFSCIGCGTCCKLACSEFSPEELEIKARYGDDFAKQFLQTFVPYHSQNKAAEIFPEYIELLAKQNEHGYYFYHCPKVTEDNKCPDYQNRPQICRDFPDNPLAFLPLKCGFMNWKLQSENICLKLNAEAEIINFYRQKIKESQKV
ncbi:YkgJ family cysteine cluster protein [bacterium]|nr:YkgJ family cysteine cluster protein [bacterium]